MFFGGPHRQAAVEAFAEAEVEFARVVSRRKWRGFRTSAVGQVGDDLGDQSAVWSASMTGYRSSISSPVWPITRNRPGLVTCTNTGAREWVSQAKR